MRALAHPTRLEMVELLHRSPASASELARVLGIRYGSAQFHLSVLARAGIALRAGERTKRGGTEVLYAIPHAFHVALDPNAPPRIWRAMYQTHVANLARQLEAAAADRRPEDAELDRTAVSDVRLSEKDVPAAVAAVDELVERLRALSVHGDAKDDSIPFTLVLNFFRSPEPKGDR
jgi:DNA-binding transcriptional ArsR family regulator